MSKINLNNVVNIQNTSVINDNFQKIASQLNEMVLYRDSPVGEPNMMKNHLDMNGKRIYNLPAPTADHEAARLEDVKNHGVGGQYNKTVRTPEPVNELPNVDGRKGRILSFDENGQPVATFPASDSATQLRIDLAADDGYTLIGGLERLESYGDLRNYNKTNTLVDVVGVGIYGRFKVDPSDTTSVDNDGTIIVDSLNRRWKRLSADHLNVKWFGAKGDGVTNDTVSIQKAIDTSYSSGGGDVYFPAGVYAVTTLVRNWDNVVGLNIKGAGKKTTAFKKFDNSTTPIFNWSANLNILETYSGFYDFSITGNNKTHDGIRLLRCARFTIDNVDIRNCDKAIDNLGSLVWSGNHLTIQGNNYGIYTDRSPIESGVQIYPNAITIENSQIVYNTAFGIFGNYANGMRIVNSDIEWNGTVGNEGTGAVFLGNMSIESGVSSASISGCWFEANFGWTIQLSDSLFTSFSLNDCLLVASENGHCLLSDNIQHMSINRVMAIGQLDTFWLRSGSLSTITDSTISYITDNSPRQSYNNVTTHTISNDEGGFVKGVTVSNGSPLKLTWGAGAGVIELAPDTNMGSLKISSPAKKVFLDGLIGLTPISILSANDNTLFIDSADGKLKFKNNIGVVTSLT